MRVRIIGCFEQWQKYIVQQLLEVVKYIIRFKYVTK